MNIDTPAEIRAFNEAVMDVKDNGFIRRPVSTGVFFVYKAGEPLGRMGGLIGEKGDENLAGFDKAGAKR